MLHGSHEWPCRNRGSAGPRVEHPPVSTKLHWGADSAQLLGCTAFRAQMHGSCWAFPAQNWGCSIGSSEGRARLRRDKSGVAIAQQPQRKNLSSRGVSSGEARRQDPGGSSRMGKPDPGQTDVGFESRPLLDGGAAHVDGGVPGVVRRCASESETSERRREGTTLILGGR
eukprot:CAMPEP_0180271534 /NCGR_PEP_ID=MMETSP0988-20121125/3768_1 /TAXON_ID=697907 /ORGANISM="non described non described, Strain CCMP2293" /LENGTH=169 /DNA_ID=CAMNT_0022242555 /DNA_START=676 /DNA_END=1186 /DNA_ORIENTATION=+